MHKLLNLIVILILWFNSSCSYAVDTLDKTSLSHYLELNDKLPVKQDIIACAAGVVNGPFYENGFPISVIYYPKGSPVDIRYFETKSASDKPDDMSLYYQHKLTDKPLFNGYLRRFLSTNASAEHWAKVSYISNNTLHLSDAIHVKFPLQPTEYTSGDIEITFGGDSQTIFTWDEISFRGQKYTDSAIYFQVVSDENNHLLSGTYTIEKNFTYYDLNNVVFNIHDVPTQRLEKKHLYKFSLMGVSKDNWVNFIGMRTFKTQ